MKKKLATTIFLLFSVFCCALEISFFNTNLWKDETGKAVLFDLHFAEKYVGKKESVNTKFSISNVDSTLDILSGNIFLVNMDFGYENAKIKSCSKLIFPQVSNFFLDVEGKHFIFDETINGLGYFQQLDFVYDKIKISPFVCLGKLHTTEGKFYWFNGKVGIPSISSFGTNVKINKNQFVGCYSKIKIAGFNYDDEILGNAIGSLLSINYKRIINLGDISISPGLGYGDFSGYLCLSLNQDNQQYLFFPYKFYDCQGNINLQYLNFDFGFEYKKKQFELLINTKYFLCLNQIGEANLTWEYKKNMFFDGKSGLENYSLDFFDNKGLVIVDVNGDWKINISKLRCKLNFGKTFVIPITFDSSENESSVENDMSSENTSGTISEKTNTDMIKTWLCSGIRIGLVIEY